MASLALKFPHIRSSFLSVHRVFEEYHTLRLSQDPSSQSNSKNKENMSATSSSSSKRFDASAIRLDQLGDVLSAITHHHRTFNDEEVRHLFQVADLDESKTISFREFLIAIAIGYFCKVDFEKEKLEKQEKIEKNIKKHENHDSVDVINIEDEADSTNNNTEKPTLLAASPSYTSHESELQHIAAGFKLVQQAFKDMDDDNSGTVDVSELKKALFAAYDETKLSENARRVLEDRFDELDFNGDGGIEFPEFLYCFVSVNRTYVDICMCVYVY